MQQIITELMGTMDTECTSPDRLEYLRDESRFVDFEQKMLKKLGDGGLDLLLNYNHRKDKLHDHQTTEAFIRGFRYGARLMAAVFDDEFI